MARRQLNGWQRLWVVVTAPWLVWIALYSWGQFPTTAKHFEFWAKSMEFQVNYAPPHNKTAAESKEIETRVADQRERFGNQQFIERAPALYPHVNFSSTLELYKSANEGHFRNQLEWTFLFLLYGIVPPALVYALGLLVRWVRAGFRAPPKGP